MIKARGVTGDGRPLILLGLSFENITRLIANEPITFDLVDLGLPETAVVIVGGRTEVEITARLEAEGLLPKGATGRVSNWVGNEGDAE